MTKMDRISIRKQIHENGRKFYDSLLFPDELRYLAGEIMALNEDYIINCLNTCPDLTVKAVEILDTGFSSQQRDWITKIKELMVEADSRLLEFDPP